MGLSAGSLDSGVGGAELPSHSLGPFSLGLNSSLQDHPLLKLNIEGAQKIEGTTSPATHLSPMAPALCVPFTSQPLPTWAGE